MRASYSLIWLKPGTSIADSHTGLQLNGHMIAHIARLHLKSSKAAYSLWALVLAV